MIERLRARLRLWFDFYDPRHGLLSLDRRRGALCGDLDCVVREVHDVRLPVRRAQQEGE